MRNRALRRFPRGRIEMVVRNLSLVLECERTARDRAILLVPTLEMIRPYPCYLAGHLETHQVVDFLRRAGLDPLPGEVEDA